MELTLQDLHDVLDKEVVFGFHYTADGGSKKITYNTLTGIIRIYVNGEWNGYEHFNNAVRAIEEFNSIV